MKIKRSAVVCFGNQGAASGFTLIEVLIAMFLFVVGLLSVASLVSTVIRGNALGKQITTATLLSQQKLEECIYKGYSGCRNVQPETYGSIKDANGSTATYAGFKREVTVVVGPAANMETVTVKVSRKPDVRTSEISTIVAK